MVNEETDHNSEMEKPEPIVLTAKNLREVLDLGRKMVILILQHDPDVKRAFKFQNDIDLCLAPYEKLHKVLSRKQSLMTDFIIKKPKTEKATEAENATENATENASEIATETVSEFAVDTVAKIGSIEVTVEPDLTLMVSSEDSDC